MSNLYLFESGSTKTTVFVCKQVNALGKINAILESAEQLNFSGYNPNRPESNFLEEITDLPICAQDHVYFYGSGLAAEASKINLGHFFQDKFMINAQIYDDITGAGRSLYHDQEGVMAILGTGGCVAYYNGTNITNRRGGYGYLIDDLGGGYELGKLIISKWINNDFNNEISLAIAQFLGFSREDFILNYYSNPNLGSNSDGLKMIAGVVEVIANFDDHHEINETLNDYFDVFFHRHVLPLCIQNSNFEIRAVGSIAHHFEIKLKERAQLLGITLSKVIHFPASQLLTFHLHELSKIDQLKQEGK
jgi:N-acetylglucosamine kinase-like BadF-type ATPase